MIAAPHTSNWDALYARLALKAMAVPVRITIKDSYMRFPLGPFIRAMGGIGINRRPKQAGEERPSMVQVMTDLFAHHPKLVMMVTPEGTRARDANTGKVAFTMSPSMQVCPLPCLIWITKKRPLAWAKSFTQQETLSKTCVKSCSFMPMLPLNTQSYSAWIPAIIPSKKQ